MAIVNLNGVEFKEERNEPFGTILCPKNRVDIASWQNALDEVLEYMESNLLVIIKKAYNSDPENKRSIGPSMVGQSSLFWHKDSGLGGIPYTLVSWTKEEAGIRPDTLFAQSNDFLDLPKLEEAELTLLRENEEFFPSIGHYLEESKMPTIHQLRRIHTMIYRDFLFANLGQSETEVHEKVLNCLQCISEKVTIALDQNQNVYRHSWSN